MLTDNFYQYLSPNSMNVSGAFNVYSSPINSLQFTSINNTQPEYKEE